MKLRDALLSLFPAIVILCLTIRRITDTDTALFTIMCALADQYMSGRIAKTSIILSAALQFQKKPAHSQAGVTALSLLLSVMFFL